MRGPIITINSDERKGEISLISMKKINVVSSIDFQRYEEEKNVYFSCKVLLLKAKENADGGNDVDAVIYASTCTAEGKAHYTLLYISLMKKVMICRD